MVFVDWTTMGMQRVNVWANGLDVDAIIHQFALNAVAIADRPTQSTNACTLSLQVPFFVVLIHSRFVQLFFFCIHRCADGTISPCLYENSNNALDNDDNSQEYTSENNVLTILSTLIVVFIILTIVFGTAIYVLRYVSLHNNFVRPFRTYRFTNNFVVHIFTVKQETTNMSTILPCTTQRLRWNDESNVFGWVGWCTGFRPRWLKGKCAKLEQKRQKLKRISITFHYCVIYFRLVNEHSKHSASHLKLIELIFKINCLFDMMKLGSIHQSSVRVNVCRCVGTRVIEFQ